jgi:hypothetical protein
MLRRAPTQISLTTEDIAIYEDARERERLAAEAAAAQAHEEARLRAHMQGTPERGQERKGEMRPPPGVEKRVRTREDRLGLTGR